MRIFKFWSIIIWWVGVDLLTKYLFFNLHYLSAFFEPTLNYGISFGLIIPRTITIIISSIFIVWFIVWYYKKKIPLRTAGLIIAWALGNLIDRVAFWSVRDFIRLWWGAVFNSADICITIGVILYWWLLWRSELSLSPWSLWPNK